jgi:hypothetical protein
VRAARGSPDVEEAVPSAYGDPVASRALGNMGSRATRRLAQELLLDERIDALRELARMHPAAEGGGV